MKSFVLFFALLSVALATQDPFVGNWKEDQYQRKNLNDYLYYRGLNWFKRVYVTNANFELTMNIVKEGNTYTVTGKSKCFDNMISFQKTKNSFLQRVPNSKITNSMLWSTTALALTSI